MLSESLTLPGLKSLMRGRGSILHQEQHGARLCSEKILSGQFKVRRC